VNSIFDILEDEQSLNVEGIYLNLPGGDDSDGYGNSDEEGQPEALSRNILQV
jgi:hypothetical protein